MPERNRASTVDQAHRVRDMFAGIAGRYDLLNHLLSGNIDKTWRKLVAKEFQDILIRSDSRVLDVACGTGDLSFTLFDKGSARIVGIDFCRQMLEVANSKCARLGFPVPFVEGDALQLPFADRSFDGATIAFGLRNLTSIEAGFEELLRVLKPGGRLGVLEFSKPKTPILRSLFKIYFTKLLPVVGGVISGSRSAYQYLPDSVSRFPNQEELKAVMAAVGFEQITFQNLSGGIAALHLGRRPN